VSISSAKFAALAKKRFPIRKRIKNVTRRIDIMATNFGILNRVKKSRTGKRMKDRKTAIKKGKSTGRASFRITPMIKTTMIKRLAVVTRFDSIKIIIIINHYPAKKKRIFLMHGVSPPFSMKRRALPPPEGI
jgi:hypothetical protein